MAPGEAQLEVERRMRDIGARLGSLPGSNKELLSLLEEAEICLSRVDQSPPETMRKAIQPTMKSLVEKRLLKHSSQGIKVAVGCCLTEVTRITAPEPPYPDDVMREVFTVVVQSFAKLDDTESPLFAKRVSMLQTVAKVRSCVLMLDLDCDDLILNTFNHFFSTISSTHQENVITSMETIMMFVIQESEPVHSDLASCLLRYLKKEKKDSLPASFMLAERIVKLCPEKLKPVFIELLKGTPLNDYIEAVALLVEGSSDVGRDDEVDAAGEDTEMVSPKSLAKTGKTKGESGNSGVSKRKRVQEVEEVPQSEESKVLDESLVGSRIKVWWPDDKKFYHGVVKSFYASSKKHKVVYDDGDIEELHLKKEKWDFSAKEQDMNSKETSDTPRGTRGRGNWGPRTKEGKTETPKRPRGTRGRGNWGPRTKEGNTETPKSSKQDSIEGSDLPKKRGRPKGVRSSMSNDDSPVTSARSKAKDAETDAEETPKAGSNLKKGGGRWPRSTGKASNNDETGSKHKGSKDETESSSPDGSKTNGLSAKRKPKEKEVESSQEEEPESAKVSSTGKRRRKWLN